MSGLHPSFSKGSIFQRGGQQLSFKAKCNSKLRPLCSVWPSLRPSVPQAPPMLVNFLDRSPS